MYITSIKEIISNLKEALSEAEVILATTKPLSPLEGQEAAWTEAKGLISIHGAELIIEFCNKMTEINALLVQIVQAEETLLQLGHNSNKQLHTSTAEPTLQ